ncbi:MAG: MATE family efflux transporter [Treponema sp.]|nr:MATE family efflux transporter [Treponema sp.]
MKLFRKDPEFYKTVFALALPIALQSLITIGVNMLDTIMVGELGETALSATSLANSFIGIYHIFCMGLGMGASVLVSRFWGMKSAHHDEEQAAVALKQTVCLMLRLTLTLAALFAIVTLIMPRTLMRMYTDDPDIINLGSIYFKWSIITYFFLGTSLVTTIVLRSVGQVRLPLFVSIGAFFVNLLANYTFIFGKFGAPRMEVAGAALGTLIARLFEAGMILGYLFLKDKKILFRIRDIFMKTGTLLGEYIRISIPVLISDAILAIGNNSVAMVIGHLGATFTAANAITSVTQQLSTVVIQGVSQAGAIVTGHTLGSEGREKTMSQGWMFLGLGFGLGAISALFIMIASSPIINAYNISEETKHIAHQLMDAISLIIIFRATNSIMTKGVLRGGGDTKMLMVTDNVFLWVMSIPLGILAGFVFHLSAFWIYVALKSDDIVKTIWCVFRLKSEKWIKKISTGTEQKK